MTPEELNKLFDELWPLPRSIAGPGTTESIKIIQKHIPLRLNKIKSGTKVFDWTVPPEWKLLSANLYTESGEKILSTDDNNLHVLNFSIPYSGIVDFNQLDKHLYSNPALPKSIPYTTSYYKRRWGFCLSHEQRMKLNKTIKYRVEIKTQIFDGFLRYGEYLLKGKSDKTIVLSSYICHPSLANNELSGPLALVALYHKLKQIKNRFYSYRFLLVPETIGSISYLAKASKAELKNIAGGIVLTCLGGNKKKVSFKHSRKHWLGQFTEIDDLVESFCNQDKAHFSQRPFTPTGGSDERQFCSPSINLPFTQASKTIYGEYKEYHSSLDDKRFMKINSVEDSVKKLYLFLRAIEFNGTKLKPMIKGGEPMLGKRDLYPTVNSPTTTTLSADNVQDSRKKLNLLLEIISLIDGTKNLKEITEFLNTSYTLTVPIIELLTEKKLIKAP